MILRRVCALVVLTGSATIDAAGQSGYGTRDCSVGPGFVCAMLAAHAGREPDVRRWASIVVIWRVEGGPAVRASQDPVAARASYRQFIATQRAAEDSGRGILGGGLGGTYYIATHTVGSQPFGDDRDVPDSVFVSGMAYAVPGRDSAIVVLVDAVAPGASERRVAGAVTILGQLPSAGAVKRWTSGDTTFIVRSRSVDDGLPATILEHPTVRAFLARAP